MSAYDYYPAVLRVIHSYSQGRTVTSACDEECLSVITFERYVNGDVELQRMYEEATRRSHDAMADALVNIDNHSIHGHSDPKMARVVSDNIKWLLGRRDARRFGDKIEVTHNLTVDRAIIDALEAGKQRAMERAAAPLMLDVSPSRDALDEEETIMRELLGQTV